MHKSLLSALNSKHLDETAKFIYTGDLAIINLKLKFFKYFCNHRKKCETT